MKTTWVELCVSNLDASIAWFAEVLDFLVVERDEDYADLRRGTTSIQIATDTSSYWRGERPRMPEAGQRGSGVEIVLLVDRIEEIYARARTAGAKIERPLETWPWRMKQFWVRHPHGYLLRPAERLASISPAEAAP